MFLHRRIKKEYEAVRLVIENENKIEEELIKKHDIEGNGFQMYFSHNKQTKFLELETDLYFIYGITPFALDEPKFLVTMITDFLFDYYEQYQNNIAYYLISSKAQENIETDFGSVRVLKSSMVNENDYILLVVNKESLNF